MIRSAKPRKRAYSTPTTVARIQSSTSGADELLAHQLDDVEAGALDAPELTRCAA